MSADLMAAVGIIPARTGFTRPNSTHSERERDHPRSRGVYPCTCTARTWAPGSSPLARGLRGHRREHRVAGRIIPARAGFTVGRSSGTVTGWDHPRSRGVYCVVRPRTSQYRGSSPLARGLRRECTEHALHARIIPRSRGVYAHARTRPADHAGSSPLARGLLAPALAARGGLRIIPARAGFTIEAARQVLDGPVLCLRTSVTVLYQDIGDSRVFLRPRPPRELVGSGPWVET